MSDGGYIAVGPLTLAPSINSDFWFARINDQGSVAWQKRYGTIGFDTPRDAVVVNGVDTIIVGEVQFDDANAGYAALMRVDGSGAIAWQITLKSDASRIAASKVISTTDGNFAVLGNAYTVSGTLTTPPVWLIKINGSGTILWQKGYTGVAGRQVYPQTIAATNDGGFLLAATADVTTVLLKLNSAGDVVWQKEYVNLPAFDDIQALGGGGALISGSGADANVAELDATGAIIWARTYRSLPRLVTSTKLDVVNTGYVLLGHTEYVDALPHYAGTILTSTSWLLGLDPTGAIQWERQFGAAGPKDSTWSYYLTHWAETGGDSYSLAGYLLNWSTGDANAYVTQLDADKRLAPMCAFGSGAPLAPFIAQPLSPTTAITDALTTTLAALSATTITLSPVDSTSETSQLCPSQSLCLPFIAE